MTTHLDLMIGEVLSMEGGYVNHPADRGGPTRFGITQRTLSKYLERAVTADEVARLDLATARDIYAQSYYYQPRLYLLPKALQSFCFDSAVNHGPRRAVRFVQSVCRDAGFGPLADDGLMGPKTKQAAHNGVAALGKWMCVALVEERQMFYANIVHHHPDQEVFLEGWLRRARHFLPKLEEAAA